MKKRILQAIIASPFVAMLAFGASENWRFTLTFIGAAACVVLWVWAGFALDMMKDDA